MDLQNLGNIDAPYTYFSVGIPEMGTHEFLYDLPYVKIFSNLRGEPDGGLANLPWAELDSKINIDELRNWLKSNLKLGSIDVNIMTKVDKDNFQNGEQLPVEFNDAHAALRGFAHSNLNSSLVLSAGMSPRLYSYIENFKDFFPDLKGKIKQRCKHSLFFP